MADSILADHYEKIATKEADRILTPLVERVTREYLLVDRNTAFKVLCMSRSYFDDNIKKRPQIRLIEKHVPGSAKTFYDPNELKRAVLSIME
ncbi:hypothetical protein [Lactiplantibacillus carotarum]|uniref:hypothetical protein n=1 Tax=Lactiplantibacillus carotarum TaxID=2993456 RepID=UPI00298F3172|nr:hypothetical protein [Lactiplantibacillus carotarum]